MAAQTTPTWTRRDVTTTDGLTLAAYETGDPERPTVVAVHGYPDDHTVWDALAAELADDFHVVAYDVRGAGASAAPTSRRGYAIPQLAADLGSVLAAVAPAGRVHLVGHDWGSIQSWAAVTDPTYATRLASFTSISGPDLDMAAAWLRDVRHHATATVRQLLASYYILGFHLPVVPERLVSSGVLDRLVASSKRRGRHSEAAGAPPSRRDAVNGLELYRANFLGRMTRPGPRSTDVPVLVLAPTDDPHVSVGLATGAPVPYCTDLSVREIAGNHWVVQHDPERVAGHLRDFIAATDATRG